jgi:hypothetical protein
MSGSFGFGVLLYLSFNDWLKEKAITAYICLFFLFFYTWYNAADMGELQYDKGLADSNR